MINKAVIFFSLVLLGGCVSVYNPAVGKKEVIFISDSMEISIGRNVAEEIARTKKLLHEPVLQRRLESIGQRVASVSDRNTIPYIFNIIDDKELNALSLPGGFIYINKGLFDKLNDDELAFVLAHEIGHVAARHAVKKIQVNMAFELLLILAVNAVSPDKTAVVRDVARASQTVFGLVSLGYSRQDEYLSDKLGVKYSYRSGFKPQDSLSALKLLKTSEDKAPKVLVYVRTHPYIDDRIKMLEKEIPEITKHQDTITNNANSNNQTLR